MKGASIVFALHPEPGVYAKEPYRRERFGKRPGKILEVGPAEMADPNNTIVFPGYNVPTWGGRVVGSENFGIVVLPGADVDRVKSLVMPEFVEASDNPADWNYDADYVPTGRVRFMKRHRRWEFLVLEAETVKPSIRMQMRDLPAFAVKTSVVTEAVGDKRDGLDVLYTWDDFKQHILDHQTGRREQRNH